MNRAVEIINSLRAGMNTMLQNDKNRRVNSLRLFNFEKNRVSLRMELVDNENISHPMGMIDVIEYPTGERQQASCNCHMTELVSGRTEKLILKLNNQDQKKIESDKVLNFFRNVLDLPLIDNMGDPQKSDAISAREDKGVIENTELFPPSDGRLPDSPRGAHEG